MPLRRDVAVAVACGVAALVLGSVQVRIPGIPGGVSGEGTTFRIAFPSAPARAEPRAREVA